MSNIDNTLDERGRRYGDFDSHAAITQTLKAVMQDTPNWDGLADDQKEALDMVAHKIGRILNGDPDYVDSWHDIIGYVRLVEQRLELRENPRKEAVAQVTNGVERMISEQQKRYAASVAKAAAAERDCRGIHIVFIGDESDET